MDLYTNYLISKNLKFAVTGHTSGIGKTIFEIFNSKGFSRSNGFDISSAEGRSLIIEKSQDCDVFVNCAFDMYSQIDFLFDLEKTFQGAFIVNLSSNSSDGIKKGPHRYATIKAALDKASEQLFYCSDKRIINLRPGYVDTDRTSEIDALKLSTKEVVEVMSFSICSQFSIKDITFVKKYPL